MHLPSALVLSCAIFVLAPNSRALQARSAFHFRNVPPTFSSSSSSSSSFLQSSTTDAAAPAQSPTTSLPSSNTAVVHFPKPQRLVAESLPIVYVYDHCPFCVRVRLALGLKNIKHTLHFLANDDVVTPTKLVGKKVAPILQWNDLILPESMEIVKFLDEDERFGPTHLIAPATERQDLKEWQQRVQDLLRRLQRPRYVATGLLPEFQQLDGRHAFVANHPLPGFGKSEWKAMELSAQLELYAETMAADPAADIEELNRQLVALNDIVFCKEHCSEGGVSYDDIDLFSRLRSITIIRDVQWPAKLRAYMDHFAHLADIPLYDEMAL